MSNNSYLVNYAEHCAEMAAEASTAKEEKHWWSEYRKAMVEATGDKNLFRKKPTGTSKPSKALIRTLSKCDCGESNGWRWKCEEKEYVMSCGHDNGYSATFHESNTDKKIILVRRKCHICGVESEKQRVGKVVMFSCSKCGKKTEWHFSNSEARDEWNNIQMHQNILKINKE